MAIKAVHSRRIYRQIADQLADLVAAGAYPAGSCLPPERDLARQLGVSRSSVREALIALEVLGVVDVRVGAGVFVRGAADAERGGESLMRRVARVTGLGPDAELGLDIDLHAEIPPFALLQARRLIEPETAALAARNASAPQLAAIEAAYRQNCSAHQRGSTPHPGDRLFHIRIAAASGNPAYETMIGLLLARRYGGMFQRLQRLYSPADMTSRSEREHLAVLEALSRRDAAGARQAMRRHLDKVIQIFSRE